MKIDMHVHTFHSPDSDLSLEALLEDIKRKGLDGVVIADHNTIDGALALKKMAPFAVIVGEEIDTTEGEILGFFMQEAVPGGLTLLEAIARTHRQGALVGVSHPFDRIRRSAIREQALLRIVDELDFLEGFNSRITLPSDNQRAVALAKERGLPLSAGSDAHTTYEIGRAYLEIPPFKGRDDFLECLRRGQIRGRLSPLWIHIITTTVKVKKRLQKGWRKPSHNAP